jgi:hypothetical protein
MGWDTLFSMLSYSALNRNSRSFAVKEANPISFIYFPDEFISQYGIRKKADFQVGNHQIEEVFFIKGGHRQFGNGLKIKQGASVFGSGDMWRKYSWELQKS